MAVWKDEFMNQICILCVDDEPEVLEAIERDLRVFDDIFPVELAASAEEARKICSTIDGREDRLGVIVCDHLMPGETGVELLASLDVIPGAESARKVLLTGQAGHEDTIEAINRAGLDYYISKPWKGEHLQEVVRKLLTQYVLDHSSDPMSYMSVLDAGMIADAIHKKGMASDF
jgi:CheY-like chemotaxis protein